MSETTLAIDVGTHSVRAAIVTRHSLSITVLEQKKIDLFRLDHQRVEQDPEQIVAAVKFVIERALTQARVKPSSVVIACQRSTVVCWDRLTGVPLGPALNWQDTRGDALVEQLEKSKKAIQEHSGLVFSPHYGATKMRWLIEHYQLHPERHVIAPLVSYIIYCLTAQSRFVCDESNANRTQLYNATLRTWDPFLLNTFGICADFLPSVLPMKGDFGELQSAKIPVVAACGDQSAAFLASVSLADESSLFINVGSGAFVMRKFGEGSHAASVNLLTSPVFSDTHHLYLVEEGTVNGAALALSLFASEPEVQKFGGLEYLLQQLPNWFANKRNHSWVYLNAVGGLGSPYWLSGLASQFHSMEQCETPPDVAQKAVAIVESMAFLLCINANLLQRDSRVKQVYVAGGLSRLDVLLQCLANLLDRPVFALQDFEATIVGAACLAEPQFKQSNPSIRKRFLSQKNQGLLDRFGYFQGLIESYAQKA